MKVYVSSHDRWAACHVAAVLSAAGHTLASTWHDDAFGPTATLSDDDRRKAALVDVNEILSADALVLVACAGMVPGGKFVEAGIALGAGKKVVVLGRRENLLLWHPDVLAFDTPQEVAATLSGWLVETAE